MLTFTCLTSPVDLACQLAQTVFISLGCVFLKSIVSPCWSWRRCTLFKAATLIKARLWAIDRLTVFSGIRCKMLDKSPTSFFSPPQLCMSIHHSLYPSQMAQLWIRSNATNVFYDRLGSWCFWEIQPGPAYKSMPQSLTSEVQYIPISLFCQTSSQLTLSLPIQLTIHWIPKAKFQDQGQ